MGTPDPSPRAADAAPVDPVTEGGPAAPQSPRPWPGRLLRWWRRSIRARIVVATIVLTAVVAGAVGWLALRQITDGLVGARVDHAIAEATNETENARERFRLAGGTEFDPATQVRQLAESLVSRGVVRGFDVVVTGPIRINDGRHADGSDGSDGSDGPDSASAADDEGGAGAVTPLRSAGVRATPGISAASVPDRLQEQIATTDTMAWTYGRLRRTSETEAGGDPAVVVGARMVLPADGHAYGVYYLFGMQEEHQILGLIGRSLLIAGAGLLALIAGVVLLVTHQVLGPVRKVRSVAERIASGRLSERLTVRGEDDIARLSTSFNQMTDALQQQIGQLVDLSRVQRQFVSDVSHELRTPLTTVRMAGDVLYDDRATFAPTSARAVELLHNELDRFENLLTDLLEISRFDAGAAVLELTDANLADVVAATADRSAAVATDRGVLVVVDAPGPCIAQVDVRRIERVLRNLITNAVDHAQGAADPRVVVTVAGDDDAVAVTVRDRGPGLVAGQERLVFNRFWRADVARTRTTGGTGLGLAIALEDTQLHGGWLEVWGRPGQGANFRLTLPRAAGEFLRGSPLPLRPPDDADHLDPTGGGSR